MPESTIEELVCPNCDSSIRSSKSVSRPDDTPATCRHCNVKFQLGMARKLAGTRAPIPDLGTEEADSIRPPVAEPTSARDCPFCDVSISSKAVKCPHCQEWLDGRVPSSQQLVTVHPHPPSPGVAAVLSLVLPGAGQMYQGRVSLGFILMGLTVFGYLFVLPGLVAHLFVVIHAAQPYTPTPKQ